MKQIFKSFAVVFLCLFVNGLTNAQTNNYNVLDIKKIASMLIAERASGQMDDAPFLDYLDSLGFKKDQRTGFYKYENGREYPILVTIGKKDNSRLFKLYSDHTICWYLFIRLKEFGLNGPNTVAKGKGLTAVAGGDWLWISYELPKKVKN